jgi:hypothetical protein
MLLLKAVFALISLISVAFASATLRDELPSPGVKTDMMCAEGLLKCLAAKDQGLDGGVFKCVNGYWSIFQDCRSYERCVSSPSPHCTWAPLRRKDTKNDDKLGEDPEMACKEGELQCLAANDKGLDGGVFKCTNGYWSMFQDCRSFERCVTSPSPHCTWAKQVGTNIN